MFVLSLLVGLADEILRLVTGCYCKLVMLSNILCGAVQIALSAVVLKGMPLWNPVLPPSSGSRWGSIRIPRCASCCVGMGRWCPTLCSP